MKRTVLLLPDHNPVAATNQIMTYIPERFRQDVRKMANRRCEYCLIDERVSENPHEIDHIVAEQHGGETIPANLCLACFECNRQKGPNLCSRDTSTSEIVSLFDPRHQQWPDHFQLSGAVIVPLTAIGRVTVRVLDMNREDRVADRARLMRVGRYPDFSTGQAF